MAKFIPLDEAAARLGISPEELTDMRSRNEVRGYRDGASWKFKPEELDRVAAEVLGSGSAAEDAEEIADLASTDDDDELIDVGTLNLDDEGGDDSDSILVTEEELGRSDESTSSTIIGKTGEVSSAESDIKLADNLDEASPLEGGSDLDLALDGGSDLSLADSDLSLASEEASAGASDVLAGDSDLLSLDDGGTGSAAEGSGIDLSLDDGSGAGGGSSLKLSGSDVSLDDELSLDGDSGGSGGLDSALDLDLEDDDLALGSGTGSDITLGASDSGINLSNPSDSGISLEDASGLGSGIDSSLELGDEIELEIDAADEDDATELQEDEEFLLSPVAGDAELDEESDDSGSQVIALDEEFDESEATMLVEETPLIAEDEEDFGGIDDLEATPAKAAATAGAAAVTTAEEGDFSVWNIVGLAMLSVFMGLCGILALDVIRNIWSWDEPYSLNSTIMDFIVGML